jgi:hypothetical protein
MKQFLFVLLFLTPLAVFAQQNPLVGEWKVELIGQKDAYHWSVKDDGTIDSKSKKTTSTMNYEIDTDKHEITLSTDAATTLHLSYAVEGDVFTFSLLDIANSPNFADFQASFGSAWDKLKGTNSVTDDAVAHLKKQLKFMLEGLPIMKGFRDKKMMQ